MAWAWSKLPSLQDQKTPVRVTSGVLNKTALQGFKERLQDAAARTYTAHTKPHLSENGHLSSGPAQSQQHGFRLSSAETKLLYRGRSRVQVGLGSSLALAVAVLRHSWSRGLTSDSRSPWARSMHSPGPAALTTVRQACRGPCTTLSCPSTAGSRPNTHGVQKARSQLVDTRVLTQALEGGEFPVLF